MTKPRALVLAAGMSTRIHPVTKGAPKVVLSIAGEPLLARNLRWLASEGIRDVFVNLHYRPGEVRAVAGDGGAFGLALRYSEEPRILGTAGAAKKLAKELGETFVVVYGDNLLSFDLAAMLAAHGATGAAATVAVFDRAEHPHTGIAGGRVVVAPDGRIERFAEGADDDLSQIVNAGVYILEKAVLDLVPEDAFWDFGQHVFPNMLARGLPLYAHRIDGYCLGIDTPESYAIANALIASGRVNLR